MTPTHHSESIRKEDLRLLNYAEFGQWLDTLTTNVLTACRERGLRIDIVAPILRSGAFPGCHLASKLRVLHLLPVQYKHTYDPARPIHSLRLPALPHGTSSNATILLTDTNTVTGEIAQRAAADLRAALPDCRIIFASVMLDISLKSLPGIDVLIFARRTNERRTLSRDAALQAGISNDVYVFPWENLEEQWNEIQAARAAP